MPERTSRHGVVHRTSRQPTVRAPCRGRRAAASRPPPWREDHRSLRPTATATVPMLHQFLPTSSGRIRSSMFACTPPTSEVSPADDPGIGRQFHKQHFADVEHGRHADGPRQLMRGEGFNFGDREALLGFSSAAARPERPNGATDAAHAPRDRSDSFATALVESGRSFIEVSLYQQGVGVRQGRPILAAANRELRWDWPKSGKNQNRDTN